MRSKNFFRTRIRFDQAHQLKTLRESFKKDVWRDEEMILEKKILDALKQELIRKELHDFIYIINL